MSIIFNIQKKILDMRLKHAENIRKKEEVHSKQVAELEHEKQKIETEKAKQGALLESEKRMIERAKKPHVSKEYKNLLEGAKRREEEHKQKRAEFYKKIGEYGRAGTQRLVKGVRNVAYYAKKGVEAGTPVAKAMFAQPKRTYKHKRHHRRKISYY